MLAASVTTTTRAICCQPCESPPAASYEGGGRIAYVGVEFGRQVVHVDERRVGLAGARVFHKRRRAHAAVGAHPPLAAVAEAVAAKPLGVALVGAHVRHLHVAPEPGEALVDAAALVAVRLSQAWVRVAPRLALARRPHARRVAVHLLPRRRTHLRVWRLGSQGCHRAAFGLETGVWCGHEAPLRRGTGEYTNRSFLTGPVQNRGDADGVAVA